MKLRLILAVVTLFATSGARAQGMPVYDNLMNLQTKFAWAKQAVDMARQIQEAQKQLMQAKATYDSLNGSRGISNLLRNPTLYNYLPPDVAAVLRANTSGLSGTDAILTNMRVLGIDQTSLDPKGASGTNFTARQVSNANYQLLNDQAYQAANNRIKQLDALVRSIDGATDPMAINALAVRVQAEQGMIANEQARLTVLANSAAQVQRVQEQQSREIVMKATEVTVPAGW